jgi:threonine dehydrogenase-like Zn-dependent dehydrogenase
VGICGSELHGIRTPGFRKPPLVMGHEFAGTTPDGRRVAVNPIIACGSCDLCERGLSEICRERQVVGIHRPGGFGQRVAVPGSSIHEIPPRMTWGEAAMVEPLANAVHAWGLAGSPSGARVGVIGGGTIGQVCLLVASGSGAGSVMVADVSSERLELARRLGASSVGSELTGEFDVVFDAVGLPVTRSASIRALRPGGVSVWLGLMEPEPGFDSQDLIRMEKTVMGSFAYTDAEFVEAIALAEHLDLSWAESFPLSKGPEIFTELMNGRTDVIKALLLPNEESRTDGD